MLHRRILRRQTVVLGRDSAGWATRAASTACRIWRSATTSSFVRGVPRLATHRAASCGCGSCGLLYDLRTAPLCTARLLHRRPELIEPMEHAIDALATHGGFSRMSYCNVFGTCRDARMKRLSLHCAFADQCPAAVRRPVRLCCALGPVRSQASLAGPPQAACAPLPAYLAAPPYIACPSSRMTLGPSKMLRGAATEEVTSPLENRTGAHMPQAAQSAQACRRAGRRVGGRAGGRAGDSRARDARTHPACGAAARAFRHACRAAP